MVDVEQEAGELVARQMAAYECDEVTAARGALAERLRVNVGLLAENAELKRQLAEKTQKAPVRSGPSGGESTSSGDVLRVVLEIAQWSARMYDVQIALVTLLRDLDPHIPEDAKEAFRPRAMATMDQLGAAMTELMQMVVRLKERVIGGSE